MKHLFPDLPYWCLYYDIDGRIAFPAKDIKGKLTGQSIVYLITKFSHHGKLFKNSFLIDGPVPRLDELGAALNKMIAETREKTGIEL